VFGPLHGLAVRTHALFIRRLVFSQPIPPCIAAAGLKRLELTGGQHLDMPLDDLLAPLTKLTALHVDFVGALPLPASLTRLTALRQLSFQGFRSPSQRELRSLLAPLTQLTSLTAPFVVDGSCRLPDLPSLQYLDISRVAEGGLALLAASCPALASLKARGSVAIGATDAAARLPALTSLACWGGCTVAPSARAQFSLAAYAPALKILAVYGSGSVMQLPAVFDKLTSLSELEWHPAGGEPLVMGTREWQALAALPDLRCFSGSIELGEGAAHMSACVSFCTQLTKLRLTLGTSASQARCCMELAAGMQASRVQDFTLRWNLSGAAAPELPTRFWELLESWPRLSVVRLSCRCTPEQLAGLCASPTVTHVTVPFSGRDVLDQQSQLMHAHRAKELHIQWCS